MPSRRPDEVKDELAEDYWSNEPVTPSREKGCPGHSRGVHDRHYQTYECEPNE